MRSARSTEGMNSRMTAPDPERRWFPRDVDYRLIWLHLIRQNGIDVTRFVRLDDGRIVRVGQEAEGEG